MKKEIKNPKQKELYTVIVYFSNKSHRVTFSKLKDAVDFGRRFNGDKPFTIEKTTKITEVL